MHKINESDWKLFRRLASSALERYCKQVLTEITNTATNNGQGFHERYLAVFELVRRQDKELARLFDDPRRSSALIQLVAIQAEGLLTDTEFRQFSGETQAFVNALLGQKAFRKE